MFQYVYEYNFIFFICKNIVQIVMIVKWKKKIFKRKTDKKYYDIHFVFLFFMQVHIKIVSRKWNYFVTLFLLIINQKQKSGLNISSFRQK